MTDSPYVAETKNLLDTIHTSIVGKISAAISALGLGTASTHAATDFATAAQGVLASSALQSFTETDPIFAASVAHGITSTQVSHWDTAYGWGNHASAGYALTSSLGTSASHSVTDFATAAQGVLAASALQIKSMGSLMWSVPTIANGAQASATVADSLVALSDYAIASSNYDLYGLSLRATCDAGVVKFFLTNNTGASVSLISGIIFYYLVLSNVLYSPIVVGGSVLDPLKCDSHITLSGGNLIASSSYSAWTSVKGSESRNFGTPEFSVRITSGNNFLFIGLADIGSSVSDFAGNSAKSIGLDTNGGTTSQFKNYTGVSHVGTDFTTVAGDTLTLRWHTATGIVEILQNGISKGTFFTGMPITDALFPIISLYANTGTTIVASVDLTGW